MFIIEKKRKPGEFALLETLKKHCTEDPTRVVMQHVYYEAETGNFISNDGRRLLVVYSEALPYVSSQCAEIADGADCTFMLNKSGQIFTIEKTQYQASYPNYKRVIPKTAEMQEAFQSEFELVKRKKDIYYGTFSHTVSQIIMTLGQPVNISFFEDLCGHGPFTLLMNNEKGKSFILLSERLLFVGMPMLLDSNDLMHSQEKETVQA